MMTVGLISAISALRRFEPLVRPAEVDPALADAAGLARHRVAGVAEVAEGHIAVGEAAGQHRLDVAELRFPLHKRPADEDDAVAVFQLERLRGRFLTGGAG